MSWSDLVDADLIRQAVEWRRRLHSRPEASFEERETTDFIQGLLQEWGFETERPLETGVVGRIRGAEGGPCVALRADIDALLIQEENEFEFASRNPGRMHACGHDGHTAMLLAVARLLPTIRDRLGGEVRLLFQPAEERLGGGGLGFVNAGVLENVSMVLGMHLWSGFETGLVSMMEGPVMASTDEFQLSIKGRGGHGAFPHQTVDALVVGAFLVTALQTVVSRRVDPLAPAVVTVGSFHAGTAFNVISEEAVLIGTTRALSEDTRATIKQEIQQLTTQTAQAFGAEGFCNYIDGNPVVVNDPAATKLMRQAISKVVGPDRLVAAPPVMGGDDFAFLAQRVPGAYCFVGTRNPSAGSVYPHHHPRFTIDEASLEIGVRIFLEALESFFHA